MRRIEVNELIICQDGVGHHDNPALDGNEVDGAPIGVEHLAGDPGCGLDPVADGERMLHDEREPRKDVGDQRGRYTLFIGLCCL